jgi:hypothetical protein
LGAVSEATRRIPTIVEGGKQLEVLRGNMPFSEVVGKGGFGTYFIGYVRSLQDRADALNMFVGGLSWQVRPAAGLQSAVTGKPFSYRLRLRRKTSPTFWA